MTRKRTPDRSALEVRDASRWEGRRPESLASSPLLSKTKAQATLAALLVVAGCNRTPQVAAEADAPLFAVKPFTLTDQNNKPFGTDDLKGKVWVATLFYTTCPGPCPMMTGRLKKIQDGVNLPDVELVSISVDPDHDTPDKMREYADAVGAKAGRWSFLTGTPQQVQSVADGLHLGYESPKANSGQIVHSTIFLLIDKAGQCRGIYHTDDEAAMKQLPDDARKLAS